MFLLFELIQVAFGNKEKLSREPSDDEWIELYSMIQEQAIAGVLFMGLDKLEPHGQKPPLSVLYDWIGQAELIKTRNREVNKCCVELSYLLEESGFRSCILKGQGNARMYPNPLLRTSGDIDVWVDGSREVIRNFVILRCPGAHDGTLHIDFPIFEDMPVEVHYKPGYSIVPKYDKRLQRWFQGQAEMQFTHRVMLDGEEVCVPTVEFDAVHQMQHMLRHFIVEGIGLRHLIDYYYLMQSLYAENSDTANIGETFRFLGMDRFASGIMWIEKEILGIDERLLLVPVSERVGRIILEGVMAGGIFGHYRKENKERRKSVLRRGLIDAWRMMKIMPVQPREVIYRLMGKIRNVKSMKEAIGIR